MATDAPFSHRNPGKARIARIDITDHARRGSDLTGATWSDAEAPVRIGVIDSISQHDIHMPSAEAPPHLSLVLLLEGQGHFRMGNGAPCEFRGGHCFLSWSWDRFDCHDFIPARTHFKGVTLRYPLPWRHAVGAEPPRAQAPWELYRHPHANACMAVLPMSAEQRAFAASLCSRGLPATPRDVLSAQASALRILHEIAEHMHGAIGATEAKRDADAARPAISARDRRRLAAARRHIDNHLSERLTLASVALAANMSETALKQGFSLMFGTSVHACVIASRCRKAAELLRDSALAVEEIARRCGFSGASHLSRHFKSLFRTTPLQYRRTAC